MFRERKMDSGKGGTIRGWWKNVNETEYHRRIRSFLFYRDKVDHRCADLWRMIMTRLITRRTRHPVSRFSVAGQGVTLYYSCWLWLASRFTSFTHNLLGQPVITPDYNARSGFKRGTPLRTHKREKKVLKTNRRKTPWNTKNGGERLQNFGIEITLRVFSRIIHETRKRNGELA